MKELALALPGNKYSIGPVAGMPSGGVDTLGKIIRIGVTFLLVVVTITSLIFFIWGGIQWITSSGDKAKLESARKRLVYAVIGLLVAFLSYFIINLLGFFFGLKLLGV